MTLQIFTFVDLYRRQLDTAAHLLTRAADHATANGIAERDLLDWRLTEDMHPLSFQLMVVVNFSQKWLARCAGIDAPVSDDNETTLDVAGLQQAIADAKAFLATLTPEQFAGRDDVPVTFEIMPGMAPTFSAGHWLSVFATTNIYFHVSIAYAILRAQGVALGKVDMFASGL